MSRLSRAFGDWIRSSLPGTGTDRTTHDLHGNNDTAGALRAVTSIAEALSWEAVAEPVAVIDTPDGDDLDACWNLGATVAAAAAGLA